MASTAPDYDAYQSAFHGAFRAELYGILDALPLPAGGRVIDVPCGNGFYTRRLAERLGPADRLTAVDACDEYLSLTRAAVADTGGAVEVRKADAYALPFADGAFDLVWCAQSLISLDPARATRELCRITTAGGVTAVLESDEFHHVLLPWPVELEAALPQAIHAASVRRYGDGLKLAPARRLNRVLRRAGFRSVRRVTYTAERAAPLDGPTTAFLTGHFQYLRSLACPHLSPPLRDTFDRVTDPGSADCLLRLPDLEVVCLNSLYLARLSPSPKPRTAAATAETPANGSGPVGT